MIGKLTKKITLQNPTNVKGLTGGTTKTFIGFATVSCEALQLNFSYNVTSGQSKLEGSYQFRIRHSTAIAAALSKDTRVVYSGNYYGITEIKNIEDKNKWIIITAKTVGL